VWEGIIPWFYFNNLETKDMTSVGGVAAVCGGIALFGPLGIAAAAICGANIGMIVYKSNYYKNRNQCVKMHFAPGVIFYGAHTGSRCG
jgi:hypothetical protein